MSLQVFRSALLLVVLGIVFLHHSPSRADESLIAGAGHFGPEQEGVTHARSQGTSYLETDADAQLGHKRDVVIRVIVDVGGQRE